MKTLVAIAGGLIGAVLGWVVAAAITIGVGAHYGLTDFEGARSMTAFFGVGPIGGLVGLVLGTWIGLRIGKGGAGDGKAALMRIPLVLTAVAGLVGVTYIVLYQKSPILNPNGAAPRLAFEIRLPAGVDAPATTDVSALLTTAKNSAPATFDAAALREEGGRKVLVGSVELYYRSKWRLLELRLPGQPEHIFTLRLAARPGNDDAFRAWEGASHVGDGTDTPRAATASDGYEIRYRVIWPR